MGERRHFADWIVLALRWTAGLSTIGWTSVTLIAIWATPQSTNPTLTDRLWYWTFTFLVLFGGSVCGIIAIRFGDRRNES